MWLSDWLSSYHSGRVHVTLILCPTWKSNNAGNLNMPKRSHKVLSLKEKVKILDLIRKGKKLYAEVAKIYVKN